ncbi:MAG: site-2 protease family protein [Pseudomonadota bacterium]
MPGLLWGNVPFPTDPFILTGSKSLLIYLFQQGYYAQLLLVVLTLILSLTLHEFGHAAAAKIQGDLTAQRAGRLTLNPFAHLDWIGFLMVILVGIGYAKPVPTDPQYYRSRYSELWIAAAGPFMNFLIAVIVWNAYLIVIGSGGFSQQAFVFANTVAGINLLLMIFNLMPLGPLDGSYIFPYLLPKAIRRRYVLWNDRYGTWAFVGLIVAGFVGLPLGQWLLGISSWLLQKISFF